MPPITVFCAFTRLEMMDRWFDDLASTDLDPLKTNLAFIVDCGIDQDGPKIYARIMEEMNRTTFRKFLIIRNEDHYVNPANIPIRRQRIAELHEQSKELISAMDGEFVLGLEDDTVFTNLSVARLHEKTRLDQVGFATAYEAGRWHNKIIGVWNFDDINAPRECWTLLPGNGWEEIDGAGFYCYLTRTSLYLEHKYETKTEEPYGPDVNYGLWLRQMGYRNFVDWSQPCGHNTENGIITPNSDLFSEHFFREEGDFNRPPGWHRRRQ